MKRMSSVQPLPALMLGVFALSIAGSASRADMMAAATPVEGERLFLNPVSGLEVKDLSDFQNRPLFSPARRNLPAPAVEEAAPALQDTVTEAPEEVSAAPNMRLSGVMEAGAEAVAVLQDLDGGPSQSLRLGDMLGAWTVTRIGVASVTMSDGNRAEEFRLFEKAETLDTTDAPGESAGQEQDSARDRGEKSRSSRSMPATFAAGEP
jgi:hypothetical protein